MADEKIISQADLNHISKYLGALHEDLKYIDNNVDNGQFFRKGKKS